MILILLSRSKKSRGEAEYKALKNQRRQKMVLTRRLAAGMERSEYIQETFWKQSCQDLDGLDPNY